MKTQSTSLPRQEFDIQSSTLLVHWLAEFLAMIFGVAPVWMVQEVWMEFFEVALRESFPDGPFDKSDDFSHHN